MSATQTKARRRDLRRAVGEDALGVINNQGEALQALAGRLEGLAHAQARHARDVGQALVEAQAAAAGRTEPLRRGFWGRLRWLVTGR